MTRRRVATIEVFAELGSPIQLELRGPGPVPGKPLGHIVNVRKTDAAAVREVVQELLPALELTVYDALQAALPFTRRG
jgi:hypothetical protein